MSFSALRIYRVEGDDGPDVTVQYDGVDLTGYTVSMDVELESGEEFYRAGIIDASDPAGSTFHVPFTPGDLVRGNHEIEFKFTPPVAPTFTIPDKDDDVISLIVRKQTA